MTFTIHWWAIPIIAVILGILIAGQLDRSSSVSSPWVGGGIILCGILVAIAFTAGHGL